MIGSLGLKDTDLRNDGSELAAKLLSLLTGDSQTAFVCSGLSVMEQLTAHILFLLDSGLDQAARGSAGQSLSEAQEEGLRESYPFDRLATKLGLPTNCDIDLRKQDELEVFNVYALFSTESNTPHCRSRFPLGSCPGLVSLCSSSAAGFNM